MAEDTAFMNRATDWTMLRMFAGALEWAYSRLVIEAMISEKAMRILVLVVTLVLLRILKR